MQMTLDVAKTNLEEILYLRNLFLQENSFQIRYNARHERGWSDSYLIIYDQQKIGYGSVAGYENLTDRDAVFEFYIIPSFRNLSSAACLKLLQASKSAFIECQSNDVLLTAMLYEYGQNIAANTILLEDHHTTGIKMDKMLFRKRNESEIVFEHRAEPVGSYVLELNNEVVATGGFLLHYNMPFADLYMEVKENCRRKGFGSFLIQELKKQCYLSGRVPAARTGMDNVASKATLIKAGLKVAGFILSGAIKQE
jgi:GNAT superfamily N-acetyltransferase